MRKNLDGLATAFKSLLDQRLDEIVVLDVERWRGNEIDRGQSPATINRDIASIKAVLKRAVNWALIRASPLTNVKKSRVDDNVKVRFLSWDEEVRLRRAIDDREERRRAERDSANDWRRKRGFSLLPSLRTDLSTIPGADAANCSTLPGQTLISTGAF